jgi:hypothetical protein
MALARTKRALRTAFIGLYDGRKPAKVAAATRPVKRQGLDIKAEVS